MRGFIIILWFLLCGKLFAQNATISEKNFNSSIDYTIQYWNSENGFPQNTVSGHLQSQDGFLWIATLNGLLRFDGNSFKAFNKSNTKGLTENCFTRVIEDSENNLWLVSCNNKLFKHSQNSFQAFAFANRENKGVSFIKYLENIGLFVGFTNGDICKLVGTKTELFMQIPNRRVNNIFTLGEQEFYVNTDKNVYVYKNKTVREVDFLKNEIPSLVKKIDDVLWINCPKGLFKITADKHEIITLPKEIENPKDLHDIFIDTEKNLWFTSDRGVYITDGEHVKQLTIAEGLSSNYTTRIFSDNENNIWIGTSNGGINKLKSKTIKTYTKDDGLLDESCGPIIKFGENAFLVSNYCKEIALAKEGKFSLFNKRHFGCVWSMLLDKDGYLWIGTYGNGLFKTKNERSEKIVLPDSKNSETIFSIFQDENDDMWVGTIKGLYIYRNGNAKRLFPEKLNGKISYVMQDKEKRMWICTTNGLGLIENNELTLYTTEQGLSDNNVRFIYEDRDNTYWIATYGGGINRLRNNSFFAFNKERKFFDNASSCIQEDTHGILWVSTDHGIFSARKDNLNDYADKKSVFLNVRYFGREDGMKNTECNGGFQGAGLTLNDGKILFPTVSGLAIVDPEKMPTSEAIPKVYIDNIICDGDTVHSRDSIIELPKGFKKIDIQFTAPHFGDQHNLSFRYKLEGFDKDWLDAKENRNVNYINLPAGEYTFKISVYGSLLEKKIIFRIPFPFWQTAAFYIIIGFILLLVIFLIIYFYLRKKRLKSAEKIAINKRYAELELKALHSQMNPHFMFNCLNTIKYYIITNEKKAASVYLDKFSELIRLFLEHSSFNSISLKDEINLLSIYIELERLRFNNGFAFELNIDENIDTKAIEIPSMLLQPYIENAIHHGLRNKEIGGILKLSFAINNNNILVVKIDDNGVGRKRAAELKKLSVKAHASMGLNITSERITTLNYIKNTNIELEIIDKFDAAQNSDGTLVVIKIPLT